MKYLKRFIRGFLLLSAIACTGAILWFAVSGNQSDASEKNKKRTKEEVTIDGRAFEDNDVMNMLNDRGMVEFMEDCYSPWYDKYIIIIKWVNSLRVSFNATVHINVEALEIPSYYKGEKIEAVEVAWESTGTKLDEKLDENVKSITFPDSARFICGGGLNYFTNLTDVQMGDETIFIDNGFFSYCASLKSVKLPSKLKYITEGMFLGCESLNRLEIPENVKTIYEKPFEGCTSLQEVVIPESVVNIHPTAFYGANKDVKIITTKGSAAEQFAKENNIDLEYQ